MLGNRSDHTWQFFGKSNPYFGVLTADEFRGELTEDARSLFFETGERHVSALFNTMRERLDPAFAPRRPLDFGCGVGRIALPLAKACGSVCGVDVSAAMLDEASRNAERAGLRDCSFVQGDDELTRVPAGFDFVHSFIVFQHIPPRRGERIVKSLVSRLEPGGFGALHFTFSHEAPLLRRSLIKAYTRVPGLFALRSLVKGQPPGDPIMEMNSYDLNALLRILKENGAHKVAVQFTETSHFGAPVIGAFLMFHKVSDGLVLGA